MAPRCLVINDEDHLLQPLPVDPPPLSLVEIAPAQPLQLPILRGDETSPLVSKRPVIGHLSLMPKGSVSFVPSVVSRCCARVPSSPIVSTIQSPRCSLSRMPWGAFVVNQHLETHDFGFGGDLPRTNLQGCDLELARQRSRISI